MGILRFRLTAEISNQSPLPKKFKFIPLCILFIISIKTETWDIGLVYTGGYYIHSSSFPIWHTGILSGHHNRKVLGFQYTIFYLFIAKCICQYQFIPDRHTHQQFQSIVTISILIQHFSFFCLQVGQPHTYFINIQFFSKTIFIDDPGIFQ